MLQCHRCGVSLPPIQAMIGGDVSGQSLHWRMVNPCPGAAAHLGQTEMVPMCAKCDPTISTLSPSQNSVEQALRIDRLSRALQKIADLPTRSAKFGNVKGKGNPMLRARIGTAIEVNTQGANSGRQGFIRLEVGDERLFCFHVCLRNRLSSHLFVHSTRGTHRIALTLVRS